MSKSKYLDVYNNLVTKAFIIQGMGENTLKMLNAKKEKSKELEKLITEAVKDATGKLTPLKTMTLGIKGKPTRIVKGLILPLEYETIIKDRKKIKQYFK